MAVNEFVPFAIGDGANALTPAQLAAASYRQQGFQTGIVEAYDHNTLFRQFSSWSSLLGRFTADFSGQDALDDGDLDTLRARFIEALGVSLGASSLHYVPDSSLVPNDIRIAVPALTAYAEGAAFLIPVGRTNTGATTIKLNDLEPMPVKRPGNADIEGNALVEEGIYLFVIASDLSFQLISGNLFVDPADVQNEKWHYGTDTGASTANALVVTADPPIVVLAEGLNVELKPGAGNTGAVTINVDGKGVKSVLRAPGVPLQAGDLVTGKGVVLYYDGTAFQVIGGLNITPQTIGAAAQWHSGHAGGTANAITVADLTPAISSYDFGVPISVLIASANTGDTTINVGGLGAKQITRFSGGALNANDLIAGRFALLQFDGTAFQLLGYGSGGGGGGTITGIANIGTGGTGLIYKDILSNTARLRSLLAGSGLAIETVASTDPTNPDVIRVRYADMPALLTVA